MSRIAPLPPEQAFGSDESARFARDMMGYLPNDAMIMAHWPELVEALGQMVGTIYGPSALDEGFKRLIGHATSLAAGCRYCQAHTAHGAGRQGVSEEKLAALYDVEASELFTEAEKAALDLAFAAGAVPNGASNAHFARLSEHYSAREQVEIVAVIAMFGFLNRWNDTLATTLEPAPLATAEKTIAAKGWSAGAHAPD